MDILNQRLSLNDFRYYIKEYDFGALPADKLVIHHTYRPEKSTWAGERSMGGLKTYYEGKGWTAGPHLFIAEDGIWLFSPMNRDGIHAGSLNKQSIGIEVVGDYSNEVWSGNTKSNTLGAIKALMEKLELKNTDIFFHRDSSPKTCPGAAINKEWLFAELEALHLNPLIPRMGDETITTTLPANTNSTDDMDPIEVPDWAEEAVAFVTQNGLFKVRVAEDVRDAVKFYRFYQLINKKDE